MFTPKIVTTLLTAATLFATTATSHAEGIFMCDDFEGYSGNVGAWVGLTNGITVSLSLLNTGGIDGNKSLRQTLGANALGGSYTVSNSTYNYTVPPNVQFLRFKHRVLVGLNLGKTFKVTLTDQDNNQYESSTVSVPLLQIGDINDYQIPLSSFTPSASNGALTTLKSVSIRFESGILSVGAVEDLDSIRLTWDNTSVNDWLLY